MNASCHTNDDDAFSTKMMGDAISEGYRFCQGRSKRIAFHRIACQCSPCCGAKISGLRTLLLPVPLTY
jgi:hypothetical protein